MGAHETPVSWLDRWRDAEPVRLYLWTVAAAVLTAAVTAGWLTQQLYVAVTGAVSAMLMLGGTAAARQLAYAPATVERLLDAQHQQAWRGGHREGWADAMDRVSDALPATTEQAAVSGEQPDRPGGTALIPRQGPATAPREQLALCDYTEDGRACRLHQHPPSTPHALGERT